jgi:hypothetical protein
MKKINTQEFIQRLSKVQPDLIVIGEYINSNNYVIVRDKLGIDYSLKPYNLLNGKVPSIASAINKTKAFNKKLQELFPNLSVEEYIKGKERIVIKDDLNIRYLVSSGALLLGNYPSIQTAIDKNKAFSIISNKIHNNYYDYSKSNYVGMNDKVVIICREHGEFTQKPGNHIQGQGCRKCADELMSEKGWTKENWIKSSQKFSTNVPKLYILKLYNDFEEFIKIGITFTTIHKRFISKLPYSYETIKILEDKAEVVFDLEKELHNKLKGNKYIPKIKFGGRYECYKYKEVLEILIKENII